jgi:hypothetical protein
MINENSISTTKPVTSTETVNNAGGNNMKNIKTFNFKTDWNLLEPHLNNPEVLAALDESMSEFAKYHAYKDMPPWDRKNGIGPWAYTTSDHWGSRADDRLNASIEYQALNDHYDALLKRSGYSLEDMFYEDVEQWLQNLADDYHKELNKIQSQFYPKEDTYQWYQCFHSGHYLVRWQKVLAAKALPEYDWRIYSNHYEGEYGFGGFSTVVGTNTGGDIVVFDILHFDSVSVMEILYKVGAVQLNLAA